MKKRLINGANRKNEKNDTMAQIVYPKHSEGPVNIGEKRLIDFLALSLPADYYIIPNGEYSSKMQGTIRWWEYDCIVVAPHAIYHLENKDWGGALTGDDIAWFVNGCERKNPLKTADLKSKVLAGKLQHQDPSWRFGLIQTALVLSNPTQSKFGLDPQSDCWQQTFLLNSELSDWLQNYALIHRQADEIVSCQKSIVDYLSGMMSVKTHGQKTEILNYAIDEVLETNETYTEYLCHPKLFLSKRYKVREYPLVLEGKTAAELESFEKQVQNAQMAQDKMELSPYIVRNQFQMNEDHTLFYDVSEYMDESTLRSRIRQKTLTQMEKVRVILDVAQGLKVAHDNQILHRDVKPENIYLMGDGHAALANFHHSWFVEHSDMNFTVKATLSDDSSPYTPPEFIVDDAVPASDLFSLGVVFYELVTGKLPFSNVHYFTASSGCLAEKDLPSHVVKDLPKWMDTVVKNTVVADVDKRWDSVDTLIEFINEHLGQTGSSVSTTTTSSEFNLKDLQSGMSITPSLVLYEELGKGGFGRVFKVKHTIQNKFYAVKLFDRDASVQETINEYEALKDLQHNNIVKFVFNDKSSQGLFFTLMELLEGDSMSLYTNPDKGDMKLPLNEVYKLAKQILEALVYMQEKTPAVYHRDIKPSNIMWDKHQRYVLIDFNISTSTTDKSFAGTYPYLAPDLIMPSNRIDWNTSADTFALGVTIYQLLTRAYPWPGSNPMPKKDVQPTDIRNYSTTLSDDFCNWVMRSIDPLRDKRFFTAKEMLEALESVGQDHILKPSSPVVVVNPKGEQEDIVDYINSLYSQSIHGNGGTRAGNKSRYYDEQTYTKTKLDQKLLEDIHKLKYHLVIITGNAGDGKTAFIRRVEEIDHNRQQFSNTNNGCQFYINGVRFESNYDGSQDEDTQSNEEVLHKFFEPFYGLDDFNNASEGRVIAINEGRLMDFLSTQPHLKKLYDNIDDYFYREGQVELLPGLMVINLNLRSVTSTIDGPSLLARQVKRLTRPDLWSKCKSCPVADQCFIKYNVDTFQDSSSGDEVTKRLEWLVRTIVYKRELHITMRDLRSMLSYMLTRDMSCDEVKRLIEWVQAEEMPEYYWQYYYFNITSPITRPIMNGYFPFRGLDSKDRLIRLMREIDMARVALSSFDRDLYYKEKNQGNYLTFDDRQRTLLPEFNRVGTVLPAWEINNAITRDLVKVRHDSFVRHHFFEGKFDYKTRLPYRHIVSFYNQLNVKDDEELNAMKISVSKAISASEGCENPQLTDNYLLLSSGHANDPISKSYRRFPLSDFEMFVNRIDHLTDYIEYESDSLVFRNKSEHFIQLSISLDLYEMLQYIRSGYNPSVNDLQGRFIELQIFKNLLGNKVYKEILVTKNQKKFTIIRTDEQNRIVFEALN